MMLFDLATQVKPDLSELGMCEDVKGSGGDFGVEDSGWLFGLMDLKQFFFFFSVFWWGLKTRQIQVVSKIGVGDTRDI